MLLTPMEMELLALATHDTRKFAIALGYVPSEEWQVALESLMRKDYVRLLDISRISANPQGQLMRVFIITNAGDDALKLMAEAGGA